jgi:hypothetical protein
MLSFLGQRFPPTQFGRKLCPFYCTNLLPATFHCLKKQIEQEMAVKKSRVFHDME